MIGVVQYFMDRWQSSERMRLWTCNPKDFSQDKMKAFHRH